MASVMTIVNASTLPFTPIASARGVPAGDTATSAPTPHIATRSPRTPPTAASSTLSARSCRISRDLAGAQRGPDRHLAAAPRGAGEQKVCDVGAGDEQHQSDRARKRENRRPRAADHPLVKRLEADARVVVLLMQPLQPHGDAVHVRGRLLERDTGSEPREGAQHDRAARWRRRIDPDRYPELRAWSGYGRLEPCRHHADHFERLIVDVNRAAEDAAIPAIALLPQPVAEDDHAGSVWKFVR